MTDTTQPGGAGDQGGAGTAAVTGDAAATPPAGGAAPARDWMANLPADLQADATLARYEDVGALARGALDLRRQASSRVIVPGETASDAERDQFYFAIGRPETADKYDIPVPEGQAAATADAFRPVAYKLGLTGAQAKGLAEWQNEQATAAKTAWEQTSAAELADLKAKTPDYDAKLAAVKRMLPSLGFDAKAVEEFELRNGTGTMMRMFFSLSDKTGEPARVDGGGGELRGGADADRQLSDRMKDGTWRERAKIQGTSERAEYERLVAAATKTEVAKRIGS